MALTQPEHYLARHMEAVNWAFPQAPPHPSPGQQAQSVEVLRTHTLPQAITATSTLSTKRKREPRPKLDNEKCARCRKDKVKCSPQPRVWPDKCDRCSSKGFECSPGEVKRRVRTKLPPIPSTSEPTGLDDQASNVRRAAGQGSVGPRFVVDEAKWDCTDLTNMVVIVQLLNHYRSLLAGAASYYKTLVADCEDHKDTIGILQERSYLDEFLPAATKCIREVLCDRQQLAYVSIADQILCENAHDALTEELTVPKYSPVSDESLVKMPVGVQIRHLIRKLRLEILRQGSCDFNSLVTPVHRLADEFPALETHFGIEFSCDFGFRACDFLILASTSLVLFQRLNQHSICNWVTDYIVEAPANEKPLPVSALAEIWNSDEDSIDVSAIAHLIDSRITHSDLSLLLDVAVVCDKPRVVRALVERDPSPYFERPRSEWNSFHYAASIGSVNCYRELLQYDNATSLQEGRAGSHYVPLHIAARNGYTHLVSYILSVHSDDKKYVNTLGCLDETPLMLAARRGMRDTVQLLLDYPGVDLTALNHDGKDALQLADGNQNVFDLILSRLPNQYFNMLDEHGTTQLHWLAHYCGQKALHSVLNLPSIVPDKEDGDSDTPLCYAVRAGNLEAVRALGVRRDIDVTKLSTRQMSVGDSYIEYARSLAHENNDYAQILDWLKVHCKELEADLADWEIRSENATQGMSNSERKTPEE